MIPINLSLDSSQGMTLLSNVFIDQYMKDANDAQIKVYLYLLRMVGANLPTNISEIADKFNDTEKDIMRSLHYWEKLKLLKIDYTEDQQIKGIHFLNPTTSSVAAPAFSMNASIPTEVLSSASAPSVGLTTGASVSSAGLTTGASASSAGLTTGASASLAGLTTSTLVKQPSMEDSLKNIERKITHMTMDYNKAKQAYSMKDIQSISSDPQVKMLLLVAERYFERPLTPDEIKILLFLYDRLGFDFELCDYLIQYCIEQKQSSIHYIEQIAYDWYEAGIQTARQAKTHAKKQERNVYAVLSYLGKSGAPAEKELSYIRRWMNTYRFSLSIIEDACGRAVLATDHHRMEYVESILKSWHENNVRSKEDIQKLDQRFEETKKARAEAKKAMQQHTREQLTTPMAAAQTGTNLQMANSRFCNIESREYDYAALERALTAKTRPQS